MRLIVARCEVRYSGRLNAFLPESTRLLMLKDDGSVLVHVVGMVGTQIFWGSNPRAPIGG